MRRETIQLEMFERNIQDQKIEETYVVAEVELVYHSTEKSWSHRKVNSSKAVYELLLDYWNMDSIELQEEFKLILVARSLPPRMG
jgi:hypothetical protein